MIKNLESIFVFTYKSTDTLLKFGGSQSWKLDPKRVMKCKYIICVNNSQHVLSENLTNHGHAFLIGKISNVQKCYGTVSSDRWIIQFDEYAEISLPNFWKGWRNPVIYSPTSDIGIDLDNINFKKVPQIDLDFIKEHGKMEQRYHDNLNNISETKTIGEEDIPKFVDSETPIKQETFAQSHISPLSIEQAKIGLSKKYDIATENIEIILKG